ncbi:MAG: hypothetical protein J6B93_03875, partial [Clostridia bacterium]|nr:hypothetical protein [Clostridia bacterium]
LYFYSKDVIIIIMITGGALMSIEYTNKLISEIDLYISNLHKFLSYDTEHFRLTKTFLENPEKMLHYLLENKDI